MKPGPIAESKSTVVILADRRGAEGNAPALPRRHDGLKSKWNVAAADVALWLAFGGLCWLVRTGSTARFDQGVLLGFRQLGNDRGWPWLAEAVRDVSGLGSNTVLIVTMMVVAGVLALQSCWRCLATLLGSVAGAEVICFGLKALIARPRPDLIAGAPAVFTASFPSAHAMISALTFGFVASLVAMRFPRLRLFACAVAVSLALLIGASRIYLGVHWPSDVLAGWVAALAWALLCWPVHAAACRLDLLSDRDGVRC